VNVTREDRRRLAAVISNRSAPQKHVWRAHITRVLAAVKRGKQALESLHYLPWRWHPDEVFLRLKRVAFNLPHIQRL
jgi:hypothetical protein